MKHLVIGATGNIGCRVAPRLTNFGARPSVLVRNAKRTESLFGDQVDLHIEDLENPGSSLERALVGVEGVLLVAD